MYEAVAVFHDKPMAPRFSNSGVGILVDTSFPHLAHHGADRFVPDLEGGVAQDLLDFPAIQTSSDGLTVNFNMSLIICSRVDKIFFNYGFSLSSLRISMLFPLALIPYRSSR